MNHVISFKMVCCSLVMLLSSSPSFGQIPNAGFEFWTTDPDSNLNPIGWQTTNSYPLVNVEPVAPGCQGTYAMKVKTVNAGFPFPGIAILETAHNFDRLPTRFSACLKSTIIPGDRAYIIVALMRGDTVVASQDSCTFRIDSTIGQFTYREFPIAAQSTSVPDSLVILVASGLSNGQVGTELIVDEFAFLGPTGVSERFPLPRIFQLDQNYPNPFNPTTTISFSIPTRSFVSLKVYDLLGREVAVVLSEELVAGKHERQWEAENLPSGVYFYRLQAATFVDTKKLVLLR